MQSPAETSQPKISTTSLADALFGATQQRVLGLLFGQPTRSFYATEVMDLADSGRGAVQRELQRLAESQLVTVKKVGNQKHYQANPESPLFQELCSIVEKTFGLHGPLRAALEGIAEHIEYAFVYGSVAKRSDTSASDIDLLIVTDDLTLEEVFSALAPAELRLGRKISPTLYTSAEFTQRRTSNNPFITRVLEGRTLDLIGSIHG